MHMNFSVLDLEVDGPTPGANSMLSLGFAASDEDEREVGVFETNLETLEGACGAENVMRWWRTVGTPATEGRLIAKSMAIKGQGDKFDGCAVARMARADSERPAASSWCGWSR